MMCVTYPVISISFQDSRAKPAMEVQPNRPEGPTVEVAKFAFLDDFYGMLNRCYH
jgi:hypothetical protein